jgi:pyridoxine kinase
MATVSFQSQVAAGAVGNSAASMVYAAFDRALWAVPTVLYSNHPAGRAYAGEAVSSASLHRWIAAFEKNGLIEQVNHVQSGYLGAADQAQAVLVLLSAARKSGRVVNYACDPVLGDQAAGLYVPPAVATAIGESLVPAADIVTPNLFELGYLTGAPIDTAAQVWAAMQSLQAMGPRIVIATSVITQDTAAADVDTFLLDGANRWCVRTPRIVSPAHGAGDVMTAAFLARLADSESPRSALSHAVSSIHCILAATGNQPDLAIHAARDDLLSPTPVFPAEARPPSSGDG